LKGTAKELIIKSLERNNGNRSQTSRELGIHKTTLFRKIKAMNIIVPEKDGRSQRRVGSADV
ncbi:MAG: Fis family transcriptional regulator, partial [Planctomycetes bacterium]|nr:Fis family transcriptional regulator [Planctomycetota bacterium]